MHGGPAPQCARSSRAIANRGGDGAGHRSDAIAMVWAGGVVWLSMMDWQPGNGGSLWSFLPHQRSSLLVVHGGLVPEGVGSMPPVETTGEATPFSFGLGFTGCLVPIPLVLQLAERFA